VGRGGGAQDLAALAAEALFKEQMRHFVARVIDPHLDLQSNLDYNDTRYYDWSVPPYKSLAVALDIFSPKPWSNQNLTISSRYRQMLAVPSQSLCRGLTVSSLLKRTHASETTTGWER
jgi:hypothetical protein